MANGHYNATNINLQTRLSVSEATSLNVERNPLIELNSNTMNNEMLRNLSSQSSSPMSALRFTRDIITSERTRNWRDNLNNVLYEMRPLVQQAQSVNNSTLLSSWIPNNNINNRQYHHHLTANNDSYVINFDNPVGQNVPTTNYTDQPQQQISDSGESSNNVDRTQDNSTYRTETHQHNHHSHQHLNNNNDNNTEGPVTEAFAQIPEARAILNTLNRYSPYICILLFKSCYDHLDGILDLFALFTTFSHANWVVRQEISKQHQKRTMPLLRELLYILTVIGIVVYMLDKKNIFLSIIFTSAYSEPFTLRNLLFSVAITDLILKLITVGIKIFITLLPPSIIEHKGRGRIYLMTESVSQLYRALAPIQPWLVYLLDSYTGSEKVMSVLLSAAYMVSKGSDILNRAKFCRMSFLKLLQKVNFGVAPSKEQMLTAGNQCPICHDSYNSPCILECNHIFCELCVGTWFDREQTCPLCRAKVVDDPSFRDGSTTFFLQLY